MLPDDIPQMRKERNYLRKNWSMFRTLVAKAVRENDIAASDFRPLSVHDNWQQIEANIYHTFCTLSHPVYRPERLWNHFKLDTYSTFNIDWPAQYLDQLIDETETVWCVMSETVRENNKLWFYEGKIKTIQEVIDETWFKALYIVSKKYEWLICINYHDNLMATGNIMPDKLRKLMPDGRPLIENKP